MKIRRLACFSFVFLFSLARCLAQEIQGRVVTPEGKPVAGAAVVHRQSGLRVLTDERGFFALILTGAEKTTLDITHPDFLAEEVTVNAKKTTGPLTITLIPYIAQKDEVVVTALRYPEPSLRVPAAEAVITAGTLAEKVIPNITEALLNEPGVTNLGSGGFSLVPSIRGLARSRVLILIDNARLTSDRRTGPSASFVAPEDIERIEVLRSPSSVFYGSDAVGGVIHILTKRGQLDGRTHGEFTLNYGTVNQEKGLGLSIQRSAKKTWFYLSLQGKDADDSSSPLGRIPQSQFRQGGLLAKMAHLTEKREIILSFLGARGVDIGKPNRDSRTKPTWYPHENQNLLQLHWREKNVGGNGDLTFQAYLNPNSLETQTDRIDSYKTKESFSKTESTDYGFQLSYVRRPSPLFWLNFGADLFGRGGGEAENNERSFDLHGLVTRVFEETPYTDGSRQDLGFFISADYSGLKNLDLLAGLRYDFLLTQAKPGGGSQPLVKSKDGALTGFVASSYEISDQFVLFANVSRAFRTPNLGERFYSGITGRGFIIAQPGLKPETSLDFDGGLKWIGPRHFLGLYYYFYKIDGMVERYLVSDQVYTYGNIEEGKIRGLELEAEYFPLPGWKVFGNLSMEKGHSQKSGAPLNDIPPLRFFSGTRIWLGHFSAQGDVTLQLKKAHPGPAEISIPGYEIVNFRASYSLGSSLNLFLVISNLLDKAYLGRPDPEAAEEPGRNLRLGLNYSF